MLKKRARCVSLQPIVLYSGLQSLLPSDRRLKRLESFIYHNKNNKTIDLLITLNSNKTIPIIFNWSGQEREQ